MIGIFGKEELEECKTAFIEHKVDMAEVATDLMKEADLSLLAVSGELDLNNFQISYHLRNAETSPAIEILKIYTRLRSMTDPRFEKREVKYVLHPTWVYPKNAEAFFVNGATVAHMYSVDLKECIMADVATEEQIENCIHLEVGAK